MVEPARLPVAGAPRAPNANVAFARALFEEWARAGVKHVCLCPGSRSAPLVVAAGAVEGLEVWTLLDERSAGFFALGLARASRVPTVLVCTSGTAAANFLPAVVEAHHARLPLVVATADRPPELRDRGAGQAIDQLGLYGGHTRWCCDAGPPEGTAAGLRFARSVAARAFAEATGAPRGAVHLNLPFREPLDPTAVPGSVPDDDALATDGRGGAPYTRIHPTVAAPEPSAVAALAQVLDGAARGAIVCGPLDLEATRRAALGHAVVALAGRTGAVVLADALSGLRCGPHVAPAGPVVASYDALLRDDGFAAAMAPGWVLRLGDTPTSKATRLWLERHPGARHVLVDPDGVWHDSSALATDTLRADPLATVEALLDASPALSTPLGPAHAWPSRWRAADAAAREAVVSGIDAEPGPMLEPRLVRELVAALPDDAALFVSNSMPVRDVDAFLDPGPRPVEVLGQRGANGIDGVTSAALGVAAERGRPVVLLTGDLAFLHDVGGLLAAARRELPCVVVVANNDGGGIFSYLPVARFGERVAFEERFVTPHGLDLAHAASLYGLPFARTDDPAGFRDALVTGLARTGTSIVEVPVDRAASVRHHRALTARVAEALEQRQEAGS